MIELDNTEKRERILIRNLPPKNKFREIILANEVTKKELEEIYKACSIAIATDRKLVANVFSVAITLRTSKREISQMGREIYRRYKTRKNYSKVQRAYFESCLVFGWGEIKQNKAIASEIVSILRYIESDENRRRDYYDGGIQLGALITKIHRSKEHWQNIMTSTRSQVIENELLSALLQGIVSKARFNIESVNKFVNTIKKGKQRTYLPKIRRK
ncbi:hypothetical protein ACNSOL_11900 (plasmid) [Aliarcobacter lanthieri]|uniref:hypothetical protein n=1 Tax=Aliarcobacter lanthieri TaxID=1355374 RepID=UPI003AB05FA4